MRIASWNDAGSALSIGHAGTTWRLAILRLWLRLPNPPLTAGSFPATILVEDGGLNRL